MARARDFVERFRPSGPPGAAARPGVPADRQAERSAELEPLLALLAETEAEVAHIRAAAQQGADLRRRRSRTGHRSAWPTSPTTRRPYTRVGARRARSRRVGRPTCWDWRSARRSPCATGCHVSNRCRNLRNPGGPSTTRSASASSAGGVSAERTATFNPPAPPDSSVAAANAGRSPRSSPATTAARAPDSAMIRRTA
jgi:hypothetical protein